jgi:hypothetical protein
VEEGKGLGSKEPSVRRGWRRGRSASVTTGWSLPGRLASSAPTRKRNRRQR